MCSMITFSCGKRPLPVTLHAKWPDSGSTKIYPKDSSLRILAWTMGFSYILVFIEGTNTTFAFVAIIVVDSMSSAIPLATFPMISAVAGAITNTSARRARAMCSTSHLLIFANISTVTSLPESSPKVIGVTSLAACSVKIQ